MHPGRLFSARFILALTCAVLLAGATVPDAAYGDTIRLDSGKVVLVESVEVLDDAFRVTVLQGGESVQVDIGFEKLEPAYLLKTFDRYTDRKSAKRRLQSAFVALKYGLPDAARQRFREAAQMDAALGAESDAGLVEVSKFEATKALAHLEETLRKGGKAELVAKALEALRDGPLAGVLTAGQRLKIKLLLKLARQLIEREKERAKQKAKKPGGSGKKPDDDPPPEVGGNVPERRTHEDERYRGRRGPRPQPPTVPGAGRPPTQGGGSGSGATGGGAAGGPAGGGGSTGGAAGGGQGSSSGGGAAGGGQGSGAGSSGGGLGR